MRKAQMLRIVLDSWWVAIVLFVVAALYLQGAHKKEKVIANLQRQIGHIESEQAAMSARHTRLLQEIASQSDPEWVEMILMKKIGVVPEGKTKVCFK